VRGSSSKIRSQHTPLPEFRPRLEALRPEFEAHGATGKWEFMMTRLAMIEAVAT